MRPYQRSFLETQETFMPVAIQQDHEMVILNKALDWDLMQAIAEDCRSKVILSTRGQQPHYRALNGAIVVRTLKNSDYRTTEDLIKNYNPARLLCDLHNSNWTPDHVSIWDYEGMLGQDGMQDLTEYILTSAASLGFAKVEGLCSDTTAQEANIPYPTEVGHMAAFARSVNQNLKTLAVNAKSVGKKIVGKMKEVMSQVAEKVRENRLFAKTKEAKKIVAKEILELNQALLNQLGDLMLKAGDCKEDINGQGKRALNNLSEIYNNMCQMESQMGQWINTGRVSKDKIISLFNTYFRAINRGKLGKKIEFGLKWGVNQIRGGYVNIFMIPKMMSGDADYALYGVLEHIRIFGEAPRDYGFDRAGWSLEHREAIKGLGVKNLAIAPKGQADWDVGPRVKERMVRERAQIEGKIGTMKKFGLNKSQARINSRVQISALRAALRLNLRRFTKDLILNSEVQFTQSAV